jgi:thiol-disulfide isomerase/thioredoxin
MQRIPGTGTPFINSDPHSKTFCLLRHEQPLCDKDTLFFFIVLCSQTNDMGWGQTYDVRALDFGDQYRKSVDMNSCLITGIAVLVLYITVLQPRQPIMGPMGRTGSVAGMFSSMLGNVSARLTGVVSVNIGTIDAALVYKNIKEKTVDLIDAKKAENDPDSYKSVSEESKEENGAHAREWMKAHENAIIMIFAPWCGHCHNAMKSLSEVASKTRYPCLMMNAETLPTHMLAGPKSVHPVEYFPTFLVKKGTELTAAPSPEGAAQELAKSLETAKDNTVAAGIASLDAPDMTSDTPFDNLF